ncbi:GGDEF domain-containing protein [Arthrobacter sp. MMS18-M83]|uniref:GGDEF domain-containing protein n=1 Tax=Arthrobacter sp. MMS18-M83 TaxID=2996261 RepID=UPI00227B9595|nr:GGDEF domain-containing protein [Arthrobacter sp. MMS18-M83]WAH98507.1 GGDEF domain-containing protein [Arthrobacter sp. MMS18-M83]
MGLDPVSLKVALGVAALTLCLLFFGSFRRSRSAYSGWWCLALVFLLTGNTVYLLTGTSQQIWAGPLGNALLVAGAFCVWAGSRSLRLLPTPRWQLLAGPVATAVAAALENPATNEWSGGLVYLAMMSMGMALATVELWRLKPTASHARRSLALAAGVLGTFFFGRGIAYVVEGPGGPDFDTYFSSATTSVVTIVLLVTVSFSMTALSNEQLINGLNERATRDGLTGLLNRIAFMELATQEIKRLHTAGSVSTLILADLDHFKALNDSHGHAAGDAAIQAFAAACQASVRHTDLVGRYGGEEFTILLPGADVESAEIIAGEISRRLASAKTPDGITFPTVSYGIAPSTFVDAEVAHMIEAADKALYQAKSLGRNRAVCAPG